MQYIVSHVSRVGDRQKNQDRLAVVEHDDATLLILGDGLGGRPGGELAAQVLIDTVSEAFVSTPFPVEHPNKLLHHFINLAHNAINEAGRKQNPPLRPGTTAVLALLYQGVAWWSHVGDSRFYLFRHNEPVFRSQDHSVVENLVQGGQISEESLADHPLRNVVTRCLGMNDNPPIPTINREIKLRPGDIIVLCSDGFWEPLNDKMVATAIYQGKLSDALSDLAERAEKINHPESDNITAIALQIMSLQLGRRPPPGRTSNL